MLVNARFMNIRTGSYDFEQIINKRIYVVEYDNHFELTKKDGLQVCF